MVVIMAFGVFVVCAWLVAVAIVTGNKKQLAELDFKRLLLRLKADTGNLSLAAELQEATRQSHYALHKHGP